MPIADKQQPNAPFYKSPKLIIGAIVLAAAGVIYGPSIYRRAEDAGLLKSLNSSTALTPATSQAPAPQISKVTTPAPLPDTREARIEVYKHEYTDEVRRLKVGYGTKYGKYNEQVTELEGKQERAAEDAQELEERIEAREEVRKAYMEGAKPKTLQTAEKLKDWLADIFNAPVTLDADGNYRIDVSEEQGAALTYYATKPNRTTEELHDIVGLTKINNVSLQSEPNIEGTDTAISQDGFFAVGLAKEQEDGQTAQDEIDTVLRELRIHFLISEAQAVLGDPATNETNLQEEQMLIARMKELIEGQQGGPIETLIIPKVAFGTTLEEQIIGQEQLQYLAKDLVPLEPAQILERVKTQLQGVAEYHGSHEEACIFRSAVTYPYYIYSYYNYQVFQNGTRIYIELLREGPTLNDFATEVRIPEAAFGETRIEQERAFEGLGKFVDKLREEEIRRNESRRSFDDMIRQLDPKYLDGSISIPPINSTEPSTQGRDLEGKQSQPPARQKGGDR